MISRPAGILLVFATGVGIATTTGFVLGVLFAPRSGEETRRILRERAMEARQKAMEQMEKSKNALKHKTDQAAGTTKSALDKAGSQSAAR